MVCPQCGYIGNADRSLRGEVLISFVLWLVLIIPGLLYSIWRRSGPSIVCPVCKSPSMIREDSPRGAKLVEEYADKQGIIPKAALPPKPIEISGKYALIVVGVVVVVSAIVSLSLNTQPPPKPAIKSAPVASAPTKPAPTEQSNTQKMRNDVVVYFKSDAEPSVKDCLWTSDRMFKVGRLPNGKSQDGFAQYVAEELRSRGFRDVDVQVIDIVALSGSGKWVKLGEARVR